MNFSRILCWPKTPGFFKLLLQWHFQAIFFILNYYILFLQISCQMVWTNDNDNCTMVEYINDVCLYPSYFTHFCVLILVAITLIAHLSHIVKALLLLVTAATHCLLNMFVIRESIICEELVLHSFTLEWV